MIDCTHINMTDDAPALARSLERLARSAEMAGEIETRPGWDEPSLHHIAISGALAAHAAHVFGAWAEVHREAQAGLSVVCPVGHNRPAWIDAEVYVRINGRELLRLAAHKLAVSGQYASHSFGGWSGRVEWRGELWLPSEARAKAAADRSARAAQASCYTIALTTARQAVAEMSPAARSALALASAGYGPEWAAFQAVERDYGPARDEAEAVVEALAPVGWRFIQGQMGGRLTSGGWTADTVSVSCPGALRPWAGEWGQALDEARAAGRAAREAEEARYAQEEGL